MTIDSTGVKFWNGTGWITPTKGAKGLPGPKGPIGPSLTPITSFANRNLTVVGSPTSTPVDNVFILSNLSTRPNEVSPPITPFTSPTGEQYYNFVNQTPWAYWVNVYFNAGVALTDTTHISIWREDNSGGNGAWTELNRSQAPLQEAGWAVAAVVIKMAGQDRLVIRGYSFKAITNYKAWMTVSPIGPVYVP